jgi:predicted NACHT family NTPase
LHRELSKALFIRCAGLVAECQYEHSKWAKTARNHHSLQEYRAITSIAALASVEMTRLDKKRSAPGTGMLEKSLPKESIPESDIPSQIGHTMLAARLGMGKSAVIDARRGSRPRVRWKQQLSR